MTRLFDLESYTKLCSYALLYDREIDNLISPQQDNFSFEYKRFLDDNDKQGYLTDSNHLSELTLSERYILTTHLGLDVSEDNQRLYIVPDRIDLLTLQRGLKVGERHLYKSVYHYWNNLDQFPISILSKPVVFIDLNSVTDEQHALLNFDRPSHSSYLIPILNNREKINQQLRLDLKFRNSYDQICVKISQSIIKDNFNELGCNKIAAQHLASYLKRIKIFQLLHSHIGQNNFSIIVEILDRGNIYYKSVCLNINLLADIVCNQIDLDSIEQLANKYKKFSFVVISDYNIFPKVRERLNSDNLLVLDLTNPQFAEIWRQKQKENFPLFSQYIDKIDFQVGKKGEPQWITILSPDEADNIYYEGQVETNQFIGRIHETGEDYFTLPSHGATLAIRINDEDYCINRIAQEYLIKHPLEESQAKSEKLRVRIEFFLKPGSAPELRVRDENNKFQIETELRDRQAIRYNCIPLREILGKREKESKITPNAEKCSIIIKILERINTREYNIDWKPNYFEGLKAIHTDIDVAYIQLSQLSYENGKKKKSKKPDLLLNINPNQLSLNRLQDTLGSRTMTKLVDIVLIYLEITKPSLRAEQNVDHLTQKEIKYFIIFLGKTYKFSQSLSLDNFFTDRTLNSWRNKFRGNFDEYFKFLSRVSFKREFQILYFKQFFKDSFYQTSSYLWGYGRVLAWYSEFEYTSEEFEYKQHFKHILKHLSNQRKPTSKEYQTNAFLSLIYLLTFRDVDTSFCLKESEEFELAKKVIELHKNNYVFLNSISKEKSLNQYFDELLSGNSSTDAVGNMLQVD